MKDLNKWRGFLVLYSKVDVEGKNPNVSNRTFEKNWGLVFPNAHTEGKQLKSGQGDADVRTDRDTQGARQTAQK